jgi:uroporphyrinogen decarboxylase
MRQAGRSLPEYRALRGDGSVLAAIGDPEVACEATLQPVRRYGVDAAILFSDIVVPLHAVGFGVDVVPGRGPVVERPFRSAADLDRLRPLEDDDVEHVAEAVRLATKELAATATPLIGFAGAPFTVASYAVEGGPSRTFEAVKGLAHAEPALFLRLAERLADLATAFASAQVRAGASAIQLFDSWAGALAPDEYERFALPPTRRVVEQLAPLGVPVVLYGLGTGELLAQMATSGACPSKATSTPRGARRAPGSRSRGPARCSPARASSRATCSTWATASSRPRTRACWPRSSRWSTTRAARASARHDGARRPRPLARDARLA